LATQTPIQTSATIPDLNLPKITTREVAEQGVSTNPSTAEESSPSNEIVLNNSSDTNKPTRQKKVSMTSFKGNISSGFQGVAQTIQLAIKKDGKNNIGLDKINGYCTIRDAKDAKRYVKLALTGTYDADGERLRLTSGQRISGENFTYCNFDFSGFYQWGTSNFKTSFSPKRDLRNKTECDNLRSSAKINLTKI